MEEALEMARAKDTKERLAALARLYQSLESSRRSLSSGEVTSLVDCCMDLLRDNNFRVSQGALQALSSAAVLAGEHLKLHFNALVPAIVERLGDDKQRVRDAARKLLITLMEVSSPTIIVEWSGSYAWTHKSWRVREEFTRTVATAIGLFASTELTLQRVLLSPVLQLLNDPNHIVREAAASCIELLKIEEDGIRNLLPLPSVTGRHETSHDDDGVVIGPPPPPPSSSEKLDVEEEDEEMIGPPRPPQGTSDDGSDSDFDDTLPDDKLRIPLSNEIVLKGHSRIVSALAVDHSGSRVLSGSYDYTVRMYDFHGMTSKLQSFRQLEPLEGHQVRSLSWSPTSDRFLCVTGSAQAKIYDRDGLTLGEFIKGDMYIRDLKNTKGHISGLTGGEWNPKSKETILTCSEDGSLRVWDVNDFNSQKQVIKPKLARPMRVPVTACAWDHEGKRIVGAVGDGSIQLWSIKPGWGSRPDIHVERAHTDDVSGLKFSVDGLILLSRSMDSSLKVWDLRQMKNPIKVFDNIPNHYPQTNAAFSPDEQLIFTGTSVVKEDATGGMLYFYDRRKLELVSRFGVSPHQSVVRCTWHPKINQVFATVGDKKEGGTHILYDPSISQRGSLVCVTRASRKKSVDDFVAQPIVHNPHALPLFRDQPSRKRQREKILKDPLKSYKPELPVTGPGFGGRVGATKGSLLTQYLMKQGGLIKETWMEEDPREAILKYADAAAKDPKFIAPAYAETQPKPVFAESDSDDEQK